MDFRLLQQDTLSQAADLWDYCFEKKGTPFYEWYFGEYALKQNRILGGFQDGKLLTMLHLNPYVLRLRGRDWKVPYIVGVATDPVARGHHVMGDLMETAFTTLRALKVPFVILMPIYAGIYQPYGFAWTHLRKHYTLPLARLDLAGHPLDGYEPERVDTRSGEKLVAPVYEKAMAGYHGYVVRDHRVWENTLLTAAQENFETVIIRNDGAPKAYALYNREGDKVTVQEMAAAEPPAKIRLLQYFKGLAGTYKTLDWLAPEDDLDSIAGPGPGAPGGSLHDGPGDQRRGLPEGSFRTGEPGGEDPGAGPEGRTDRPQHHAGEAELHPGGDPAAEHPGRPGGAAGRGDLHPAVLRPLRTGTAPESRHDLCGQ